MRNYFTFKKGLLSALDGGYYESSHPFHYQVLHRNPASPHAPVGVIVSHIDDLREVGAAVGITEAIKGVFQSGKAPSVVALSAQHCSSSFGAVIAPLLAETEVSAIVTVGGWTAQNLGSSYIFYKLAIPYVFSGIHDASHLDLLEQGPWRRYVTGVVAKHPDYRKMLQLLRYISPHYKRALVLQHPDHLAQDHFYGIGYSVHKRNLDICRDMGFEPEIVPVQSIEEIRQKISDRGPRGDYVLLTGTDSVALSNMESLVYTANVHQVPLLTQCLDAVEKGAALGCGAPAGYSARLVAERLNYVIASKVRPDHLSIDVIEEPSVVHFNDRTMHYQGLYPTPEQLAFLNANSIYAPHQYAMPEQMRMQVEAAARVCCES